MPITFPSNPNLNQTYSSGDRTWVWVGSRWRSVANIGAVGGTSTGGANVTVGVTAPTTTVDGSLWFDTDTGDLLVRYGQGWAAVGGAQGATGATGPFANLSAITGNLIPASNVTYDLGTSSFRWRDIYLSGDTIDLGGTAIRATANGITFTQTINSSPVPIQVSSVAIRTGANTVTLVAGTSGLQAVSNAGAIIPLGSGGGASVTVSNTVPGTTTEGSLWLDSDTGDFFVRFGDAWAAVGGGGSSGGSSNVVIYDTMTTSTGYFDLPTGNILQRPVSPNNGIIRYNSEIARIEYYDSLALSWMAVTSTSLSTTMSLDYLVVAGGGGGGGAGAINSGSGGGGGGGFRTGTTTVNFTSTYTITVGAGGTGGPATDRSGSSVLDATAGGNSVFATITSAGGGASPNSNSTYNGALRNGGSGAGGTGNPSSGIGFAGTGNTPSVSPSQGNNGGISAYGTVTGTELFYGGGGGGGAGGVGGNAMPTGTVLAGNGGIGGTSIITGTLTYYAGGGGGGNYNSATFAPGGLGGGGSGGGNGATAGSAGTTNTGGGGGGTAGRASGGSAQVGGAGGSGIVILRYPSVYYMIADQGLTSSTLTVGANKISTFTAGTGNVFFSSSPPVTTDILVVGGGAGGGWDVGGGGGAGGLVYATNYQGLILNASYLVTVGAGSPGSTAQSGSPQPNGSNSTFGDLVGLGGGGGANYNSGNGTGPGGIGGSGGGGVGWTWAGPGAAGNQTTNTSISAASRFYGYGNAGGAGAGGTGTGGGGGGAGGAGSAGIGTQSSFAAGGPGLSVAITGTSVTYAAGGKGGGDTWTGTASAAANLGNGGDGAGTAAGGAGGSGVVIISYPLSYYANISAGLTYETVNLNNLGVRYTRFTAGIGTFALSTTPPALTVEYLVVAGGGGGGTGYAGGGGAGGFRVGSVPGTTLTSYNITIGAGGTADLNGSDSVFSTITSAGGGRGGGSTASAGGSGGSGGGGRGIYSGTALGGTGNTPAVSPSQGFDGGPSIGNSSNERGGGGGGAGGIGGTGTSGASPGAGGVGASSSITGTLVTYAGGGGGGNWSTGSAGPGGSGGGGAGSVSGAGTAGTTNTGGGGGGGGGSPGSFAGGTGGSGIVILRIPSVYTATVSAGLTFTNNTTAVIGSRILSFTAGTGTVSFSL